MSQLKPTPRRILLVCIGNRVRSPLAQGFLRAELDSAGLSHVEVDSAGTNVWPGGEPPEREAIFEAARAGVDIAHLRSRELIEAEHAKLAAQSAAEYAESMVRYNQQRITRLMIFIKQAENA